MAQGNVEFTKKVNYQIGKTDYADVILDDEQKIQYAQHILNAQINSGDLVTDVEMPVGVLGASLDWGEGVIDDLLVGITTGTGQRIAIVQDLSDENLKVEYQDRFILNVKVKKVGGTFTFPTNSSYIADFLIDWGDGTSSDITSWNDPNLNHVFPTTDYYDVEVKGICEYLYMYQGAHIENEETIINLNKKMTNAQNLKVVGFSGFYLSSVDESWSKWENVEIFDGVLARTPNIRFDDLPDGLFKKCIKVKEFKNVFNDCDYSGNTTFPSHALDFSLMPLLEDVSGTFKSSPLNTIPSGIFDGNPLITNFSEVFYSTPITTIPTDLFRYNTAITTFDSTFILCSSLTTIPEDLFRYNTSVLYFRNVFQSCASLTTIPAGLFQYNTIAQEFSYLFASCDITAIPVDLFRYNTAATNFLRLFFGNSNLTDIPTGMFDYNVNALNMSGIFEGCSSITTIPDNLFDNNILATTMNTTFISTGITEIPVDLLRYNIKLTGVSYMFSYTDITAIPVDLFRYNTDIIDFSYTFNECSLLTTIPVGIFDYNTLVTNFSRVFEDSGITEIPVDLFRYNTLVTNFSRAFQYCAITSIPVDIFRYNTLAYDFTQTFAWCSNVTTIPIDLFRYNVDALFFTSIFGASGITSIPVGMFDYNTKAYAFGGVFSSTSITEIPADLFRYTIASRYFDRTFYYTPIKSIPDDLFRYNTLVTNFYRVFGECADLYDVPDNLFEYNTLADNFSLSFANCTSLSGSVTGTGELYDWMQSHSPTTTTSCFTGCTGIQDWDLIPSTWGGGGLAALTNTMTLYFDGSSADWDLTLGINDALNIGMDIDVDWGDGSGITTITDYTSEDAIHNYTNGLVSNTLTITGKMSFLILHLIDELTEIGALTRDLGLIEFSASGDNLTTINGDFFSKVNQIEYIKFNGCPSLSNIGSSAISGQHLINIKSFFSNCTSLTTIPSGFLDKCYNVDDISYSFHTSDLTSIPSGLFDSCTLAADATGIFANTSNLTTIPTNLFDNNILIEDFSNLFNNSGVTSIPADLFKFNTAATSFEYSFLGCNFSSIPADLFRYNTLTEDFHRTFYGCTSLTLLPADLFLYNTSIVNIIGCFEINNLITTAVTGAGNLIAQVETNNASVDKTGCFDGCTSITDYASIPIGASDWRTV